jgi:hypothetical protein
MVEGIMPTTTSDICDLFLSRIEDFRINAVYATSGSMGLTIYLEPYLIDSIVEFEICNQDLTYTPTTEDTDGYFAVDLNLKNKKILSSIMIKSWLSKTINSLNQMQNIISDHDFKQSFSPAQNLTAKKDYLNTVKEEISQLLVDYSFANNDWTSWNAQIFN